MHNYQPIERQQITLQDYIGYLNRQLCEAKVRNMLRAKELNWECE